MIPRIFSINPLYFGLEFALTTLIAILGIIIFIKTKDMQRLSGKNSIKLFRYSFLFFSIAYISRFILMIFMATSFLTESHLRINPSLAIPLVAFASFIAIIMLAASSIKPLHEKKYLMTKIFIYGFLVFIITLLFASLNFFIFLEIGIFLFTLGIIYQQNIENKRNSKHKIYALLFLFWIFSIGSLYPTRLLHLPREVWLIPQLISLVIFIIIFRKVRKWV